jgi:DNA gyrase subunit A
MDDNKKEQEKLIDNTKFINVNVNTELKKSFISYAMAVNISRAIPDVRDGLKPVHRRILYAMGELNLFNDKPFKKCARIVGDVMGKYHPHGDSSIYDALVRMAQDFTINSPLIDGHGNFGSVDGDSPAAMRYTEARLSKIAGEMLKEIEKETVEFYPNFDDTLQQPKVLPSRFPNLLVNGSDGIAVGMATNIPPHNLTEVIDACIALINNPEITIDELIQILPAPDFPTKGLIMGRAGIRKAYETGRGSFLIRSRAEIEEYNNGTRTRIVITEIPYQVNKAKLIVQIADLVKNKKIEGISDIKEESDRTGMRIVIEVKRDANAQVVLNSLYKQTQLQTSFGIILLALVNGVPKVINLREYLENFVAFQKEIIINRTSFDLNKARAKEHILHGLVIAQANIDEVIKTIKQSSDKQDAQEQLIKLFELSEKQAQAILEMRLQRLTGLEVEKLKQELLDVQALIEELVSILKSEDKIYNIIKGDLVDIKQRYGVPRKSEISTVFGDIDEADLIEEQQVVISLSHEGYIKRIPIKEYKSQHRGGKGVITMKTKEEDFVENIFSTSTHDNLLCFSSLGRVYRLKGYEVPEASKNSKGRAMVNLLQLSQGERITAIIPLKDEVEGHLIMATKRGLIKKTKLSEFESIRKVGKIAIKLNENDELISVYVTSGNDEIIIASSEGKCIRFNESNVRVMGRDTQGVKSIALSNNEYVVDMAKIYEDKLMLTISEFGYGKRSEPSDYRVQGRAGKGIKAGIFNTQTGNLVNLKQVSEKDDVMIIADDGQIIRIKASAISKIGRNTKGVRLMTLGEGAKIVGVAVVPSEEFEDELAESLPDEELTANNTATEVSEDFNEEESGSETDNEEKPSSENVEEESYYKAPEVNLSDDDEEEADGEDFDF